MRPSFQTTRFIVAVPLRGVMSGKDSFRILCNLLRNTFCLYYSIAIRNCQKQCFQYRSKGITVLRHSQTFPRHVGRRQLRAEIARVACLMSGSSGKQWSKLHGNVPLGLGEFLFVEGLVTSGLPSEKGRKHPHIR